jgi:hypothetical protein
MSSELKEIVNRRGKSRWKEAAALWFARLFGERVETAQDRAQTRLSDRHLARERDARELKRRLSRPLGARGMPWLKAKVLARIAARNKARKERRAAKRPRLFTGRFRWLVRKIA